MVSKLLNVRLDATTWPKRRVPSAALTTSCRPGVSIDAFGALLMTALVTRSPGLGSFHLSDFWAWIRYFHALSLDPDLRISNLYKGLDPHQKTILSDDWGMGFPTFFLSAQLGVWIWIQTNEIVRNFPKHFYLSSSGRRGPKKSPDFIGVTNSGSIVVLECKGTQDHKSLQNSMSLGSQQKNSLRVDPRIKIDESLVSGLFIAFEKEANASELVLHDPPLGREGDWPENGPKPAELRSVASRLQVASALSLAGQPLIASELRDENWLDRGGLSEEARQSLEALVESATPGRSRFQLGQGVRIGRGYVPLVAEVGVDPALIASLLEEKIDKDPFEIYGLNADEMLPSSIPDVSRNRVEDGFHISELYLPSGVQMSIMCGIPEQ